MLHQGFKITQVHGPEHGGAPSLVGQWVFRKIHQAVEAEEVQDIVTIDESGAQYIDTLNSRLRENGVVSMSGFGPLGRRFFDLNFLGVRQQFATGIVSLAMVSGAALIPTFCFRDSAGTRHLVFEKPADMLASRNGQELYQKVLEAYSRLLESYVKQYPEQWTRWHAPLVATQAPRDEAAKAAGKSATMTRPAEESLQVRLA